MQVVPHWVPASQANEVSSLALPMIMHIYQSRWCALEILGCAQWSEVGEIMEVSAIYLVATLCSVFCFCFLFFKYRTVTVKCLFFSAVPDIFPKLP